jgi:hypothetical protein
MFPSFVMFASFMLRAIIGIIHELGHAAAALAMGWRFDLHLDIYKSSVPPFGFVSGYVNYLGEDVVGLKYAFTDFFGPLLSPLLFSILFLIIRRTKQSGRKICFVIKALFYIGLSDAFDCLFPSTNSTVGINDGARILEAIGQRAFVETFLKSDYSLFLTNWWYVLIKFTFIWLVAVFLVSSLTNIKKNSNELVLSGCGYLLIIMMIGNSLEYFIADFSYILLLLSVILAMFHLLIYLRKVALKRTTFRKLWRKSAIPHRTFELIKQLTIT